MSLVHFLAASVALLVSQAAHAGVPPQPAPEPATWALIGLAAVVGVVISRNRRK